MQLSQPVIDRFVAEFISWKNISCSLATLRDASSCRLSCCCVAAHRHQRHMSRLGLQRRQDVASSAVDCSPCSHAALFGLVRPTRLRVIRVRLAPVELLCVRCVYSEVLCRSVSVWKQLRPAASSNLRNDSGPEISRMARPAAE